MKLITIIGRIGMILFMMGLALVIVALLPPRTTSVSLSGGSLPPQTYSFELYGIKTLTVSPRIKLYVSVTASSGVRVYLLNVSSDFLSGWALSWIKERFPSIKETDVRIASLNITVLNAFLEANPNTVLWKSDMIRTFSKEFSFSHTTNCTVVISNPSSECVEINVEERVLLLTVPEESFLKAQLLISAGIALAIPWIILSVRERIVEYEFKHKISR